MNHESPFAPPRATPDRLRPNVVPVGPVRAVLGLLICLYAIAVLGWALWLAAVATEYEREVWFVVALLLVVGVPSLIGGWRWTDRRRAWPWLLGPAIFHLLIALGLAGLWLSR